MRTTILVAPGVLNRDGRSDRLRPVPLSWSDKTTLGELLEKKQPRLNPPENTPLDKDILYSWIRYVSPMLVTVIGVDGLE